MWSAEYCVVNHKSIGTLEKLAIISIFAGFLAPGRVVGIFFRQAVTCRLGFRSNEGNSVMGWLQSVIW